MVRDAGSDICGEWAAAAGSFTVAELDWQDRATWTHVMGPFDYILAADCIYNEALIEHLLEAVLQFCGLKTTGVSLACSDIRTSKGVCFREK